MNKRPTINRRDFLRLTAIGAVGLTLTACDSPETIQKTIATMRPGGIIFNRYAQPDFGSQTAHLYSNDPVVRLDEGPVFLRNKTQLGRLPFAHMPDNDSVFGSSLEWAYRGYIVNRLSC